MLNTPNNLFHMQHTKWKFHGVIERTLLAYLISRFTNPRSSTSAYSAATFPMCPACQSAVSPLRPDEASAALKRSYEAMRAKAGLPRPQR